MGLRFRKSIKILPGVRLNFGKNSMSVSAGVPGFRKTFSSTGRVTTTVGIPGTGLYYVDTKNKNSNRRDTPSSKRNINRSQNNYSIENNVNEIDYVAFNEQINSNTRNINELIVSQINVESLKNIHKNSDDSIDWTEILVCDEAPDESYNQELWKYYHEIAPKILAGDIDSYLQLIYEINPLDDLLDYGSEFEFGTDNPKKITVEFKANIEALANSKSSLTKQEYNDLLQDYLCSVCIRIARDMFALLPISNTIVHVVLNDNTIISINFDRKQLCKLRFGFVDPSDTFDKFKHNMNFVLSDGFAPVDRIE